MQKMNRKYALEDLIKDIFQHSRVKSVATAMLVADLDFEALSQALRYDMEPIYRFRSDNYCEESCEYRSELLLPVQGTLIYEQTITKESSLVTLERGMELWILDDLSIAVLVRVKVADSSDMFNCVYRVVRTQSLDELPYEIDLDLDVLAELLQEMSNSFRDCSMPFSEL